MNGRYIDPAKPLEYHLAAIAGEVCRQNHADYPFSIADGADFEAHFKPYVKMFELRVKLGVLKRYGTLTSPEGVAAEKEALAVLAELEALQKTL